MTRVFFISLWHGGLPIFTHFQCHLTHPLLLLQQGLVVIPCSFSEPHYTCFCYILLLTLSEVVANTLGPAVLRCWQYNANYSRCSISSSLWNSLQG